MGYKSLDFKNQRKYFIYLGNKKKDFYLYCLLLLKKRNMVGYTYNNLIYCQEKDNSNKNIYFLVLLKKKKRIRQVILFNHFFSISY